MTLPCTISETLNMAHVASYLNAEIILVVTASVALDTSSLSPPTSLDFGPRLYRASRTGR